MQSYTWSSRTFDKTKLTTAASHTRAQDMPGCSDQLLGICTYMCALKASAQLPFCHTAVLSTFRGNKTGTASG